MAAAAEDARAHAGRTDQQFQNVNSEIAVQIRRRVAAGGGVLCQSGGHDLGLRGERGDALVDESGARPLNPNHGGDEHHEGDHIEGDDLARQRPAPRPHDETALLALEGPHPAPGRTGASQPVRFLRGLGLIGGGVRRCQVSVYL